MSTTAIYISDLSDFNIEVMETDKDHIHMMICSEPKLSPLQIVRRLKQMSTTAIWKRHENYLRHVFYWENTFWTDGYFGNRQRPYSHDDMQRTKTLSAANRKEAKTNVNNCHLEKT